MAAEHHQCLAGFELADQLDQGALALVVQVGVGFVQHHVHRVAVHRTRNGNALLLAAGQGVAGLAQLGLVTLRKTENGLVHANGLGGGHHFLRINQA